MEDVLSPPDLICAEHDKVPIQGEGIPRKDLVNKLNLLHFLNRPVHVTFKRRNSNSSISVSALPLPCRGEHLDCIWIDPEIRTAACEFENLLVPDGKRLLVVRSSAATLTDRGILLLLPDTCQPVRRRKSSRFHCENVRAEIVQNSIQFAGRLIDFNATSFRLEIESSPTQTFQWLAADQPIQMSLCLGNDLILSSPCRVVRQTSGRQKMTLVLQSTPQLCRRFEPNRYRSRRVRMQPPPSVRFQHPLTGKVVFRKGTDLSGSGLALEEQEETSVLIPGMIIPQLEILLGNHCRIRCRAQVIHKTAAAAPSPARFRLGLVFLDMDSDDHLKILSVIHQAEDESSYFSSSVNVDDLFRFFFETGFLYPEKYAHLAQEVEGLRQTYHQLYSKPSSISRHFTYIERDEILGHLGMIRFYNRSWLIHHHAAQRSESRKAGLAVLTRIGRTIKEAQRLPSSRMDYVLAYFRPENKFPQRVFGGAAGHYDNPRACSIDPFFYFLHEGRDFPTELPATWDLAIATDDDLRELEWFYAGTSGGLLLKALDLEPGMALASDLVDEYSEAGLRREKHLYSLRHEGNCRAVFLVNVSAVGLNLSDLMNAITVVTLGRTVSADIMASCLDFLSFKVSGQKRVPVLFSPVSDPSQLPAPPEKTYNLWILDCSNLDPYFEFCEKRFGIV